MARGGGTYLRVEGIEQVQKALMETAPKAARNLMRATIQKVASDLAKEVKAAAPVDSGNLKKSIGAKRKNSHPDRPVSQVLAREGKKEKYDGFYWKFIEYGTKHISPAPFIGPIKAKAQSDMPRLMREAFTKKLEDAVARELKKAAKK